MLKCTHLHSRIWGIRAQQKMSFSWLNYTPVKMSLHPKVTGVEKKEKKSIWTPMFSPPGTMGKKGDPFKKRVSVPFPANNTENDSRWRDVTWRDVTWRDVTWRDVTWRDVTWRDVTWRAPPVWLTVGASWSLHRSRIARPEIAATSGFLSSPPTPRSNVRYCSKL